MPPQVNPRPSVGVVEPDDWSVVTDPRVSPVCVTASPFGKAVLTLTYDNVRVCARACISQLT